MMGFSTAGLSSMCTAIAHRALSSAVELDELSNTQNQAGPVFPSLSAKLHNLSKTAESLGAHITRTPAISPPFQEVLTKTLDACGSAAAVVEKEVKSANIGAGTATWTEYESWAALQIQAFRVLHEIAARGTATEQDETLAGHDIRKTLVQSEAASRSLVQSREDPTDEDDDAPPGYDDGVPGYPGDVKDATLLEVPYEQSPTTSSPTPSSQPGPSQSPEKQGFSKGLASFSESFRAMTAPFRYKPEPLVIALCEASTRGNVNQISSLLGEGANIDGRDEDGKTPIVRAIEARAYDAVKALLVRGASKGVADTAKKIPPLFWAAGLGDLGMAALLLSHGCSPRDRSVYGTPYFMETCANGPLEMVRLMLDHGADVTTKDAYGREILVHAVQKGDLPLIMLLLERGASPATRDNTGSPIVVMAMQVYNERPEVFRKLLEHGADVNSSSIRGTPMVVDALKNGWIDLFELLLSRGANPNAHDAMGASMLHSAIKDIKLGPNERLAVIKSLLEHGANPNVVDRWHWTAMDYILDQEMTECIPMFLQRGIDPNRTVAKTGQTLLLQAIDKGNWALASQLLKHGANPNVADKKGRTPLLETLLRRETTTAALLVDHGADVNKAGMVTPLALAKISEHGDAATLLSFPRVALDSP